MEVEEAEKGEEEEEPSQEPQGISLGSYDTSEEDRDFVQTHMA
jgi:hypothetical protein